MGCEVLSTGGGLAWVYRSDNDTPSMRHEPNDDAVCLERHGMEWNGMA